MVYKLYEIPRHTRIKVGDARLMFERIDGMYSICYDADGNTIHLAAWTEVELDE